MKRTLVSLAAAAVCDPATRSAPVDLVGHTSPSPQRQSSATLVPPDDSTWWAEQLKAPMPDLEGPHKPLLRGELGRVDWPLGDAFLRRDREQAENVRMSRLLDRLHFNDTETRKGIEALQKGGLTRTSFDGEGLKVDHVPLSEVYRPCSGCYLCEPGPFDAGARDVGAAIGRWLAQPDPHATQEIEDAADRAEVERINMTGARQREATRLTPFGAEPWDMAAGECS